MQRNSIKGQLNSLDEFLKAYSNESGANELKLRVQSIQTLFENFDYIHSKIDTLDDSETSVNQRFSILNHYFKVMSTAQHYLAEMNTTVSYPNSVINHDQTSLSNRPGEDEHCYNSSSTTTRRRKLKLPEVKLPEFSGNAEKWLSFKNAFASLVHNDDDLTNIEKLHHLRSAVSGDALDKIQIFPISEENYHTAWNTLIEAYENKRNLISHHLTSLLHLPSQEKHGYKSLATLSNRALQHVKSLSALGVKVADEIVVQIIEEKLTPRTYHKWEDSLSNLNNNEFPSLKHIIKFLDRQVNNASKREKYPTSDGKSDRYTPANKIRKIDNNFPQALVTASKKCSLCLDEYHQLFQCNKFRNMPVENRIAHVRKANACFRCLRNHGKGECKFGGCPICNKPHNSLLHFPKSKSSKAVAPMSSKTIKDSAPNEDN